MHVFPSPGGSNTNFSIFFFKKHRPHLKQDPMDLIFRIIDNCRIRSYLMPEP